MEIESLQCTQVDIAGLCACSGAVDRVRARKREELVLAHQEIWVVAVSSAPEAEFLESDDLGEATDGEKKVLELDTVQ